MINVSHGSLLAVFQRVQSVPSHALLASTASTAARIVPVETAGCATTSRGSASAQLASVDAGMQQMDWLSYFVQTPFCEELHANFCTPATLKIGQIMA